MNNVQQAEVIAASDQLRAVLDGVRGAFAGVGIDGAVTTWTVDAERIFGYTLDEAIGQPLIELLVPGNRRGDLSSAFVRYLKVGARNELERRLELPAADANGADITVGVTVSQRLEGSGYVVFLNDITSRAAVQRELKEANQLLAAILENTRAAIFAKDLDGRYLFVNSTFAALYELQPHEMVGHVEFDLVNYDEAMEMRTVDQMTLDAPGPITVRRSGSVNGGTRKSFISTRFVLRDADGEPRGLCGIAIDDTEREIAETARNEAEAAYQRTIANIPGIAFRSVRLDDGTAWFDFVSEGSRSVLGIEPEALLGPVTNISGRIHVDDRPSYSASLADTVGKSCGWRWEGRIQHQDGSYRWIQAVAHSTYSAEDSRNIWDGLLVDRTQEKATEDALLLTKSNFDRVVAELKDYVATVEIHPDGRTTNVYASPDQSGIFGGSIAEARNQFDKIAEMIHPHDVSRWEAFRLEASSGEPVEAELRLVGLDGVERWIWFRVRVRDMNGHRLADAICSNVTERHRLMEERAAAIEALAVRNDELETANQFKLDLIGMLSHDIGNPMTAILGYTELALGDETLDPTTRMYLNHVTKSVNALEDIRREALTMCSIDAGKLVAERERVNVKESVQHLITANRVDVHLDVPTDLEMMVHPIHFLQILGNFMSNANKYGDGVTAVEVKSTDSLIEIRVCDEGPGIPADFKDQLFERFSRSERDAAALGSGLGLFIVKSLAEANRGTVWYEVNEPKGTVFVLQLERA